MYLKPILTTLLVIFSSTALSFGDNSNLTSSTILNSFFDGCDVKKRNGWLLKCNLESQRALKMHPSDICNDATKLGLTYKEVLNTTRSDILKLMLATLSAEQKAIEQLRVAMSKIPELKDNIELLNVKDRTSLITTLKESLTEIPDRHKDIESLMGLMKPVKGSPILYVIHPSKKQYFGRGSSGEHALIYWTPNVSTIKEGLMSARFMRIDRKHIDNPQECKYDESQWILSSFGLSSSVERAVGAMTSIAKESIKRGSPYKMKGEIPGSEHLTSKTPEDNKKICSSLAGDWYWYDKYDNPKASHVGMTSIKSTGVAITNSVYIEDGTATIDQTATEKWVCDVNAKLTFTSELNPDGYGGVITSLTESSFVYDDGDIKSKNYKNPPKLDLPEKTIKLINDHLGVVFEKSGK